MSESKEFYLELYQKMLKIRLFEENVVRLFAEGFIPGFVHSYIGEEAVAVGVCSCLNKDDYITSTHRGHGHLIAKGGQLNRMMAELFGKKDGYCKGKGGSMHIADFDIGILGANGIVGGSMATAVGVALSVQMRGTKQVIACFFGDGATNRGIFHESLNLASIWNVPVIFICENNLYAISVPQTKAMKIKEISKRADSYGIPGVTVDGNDVLAVRKVVGEAVIRARRNEGPTLIECRTYRWRGHFEGDPDVAYRSKREVEEWKKRCPILSFKKKLYEMNVLNDKKAKDIEQTIKEEIERAIKYAEKNPFPDELSALQDVYSDFVEEAR
ncbi:Acetoin:2,6-dichlorophenolindophenol oxidoreductase subunit alpha [subsurface metagenome]|jgi:pyruvate dehydrogenase E1 component alpha subunit